MVMQLELLVVQVVVLFQEQVILVVLELQIKVMLVVMAQLLAHVLKLEEVEVLVL